MFPMTVAPILAALCLLMAATLKWGARGAVGGYMAGLAVAALIWPAFIGYAALKFGLPSESYRYAKAMGWAASLSVGAGWAVCGLVAILVAALAGVVVRLIRPLPKTSPHLDF
jgi:hypothetical protein